MLLVFLFRFAVNPITALQICAGRQNSGGYSAGVPPLPIPNREVKPGRADGTAPQCGRVGRRRPHVQGPFLKVRALHFLYVFLGYEGFKVIKVFRL